MLMQFKVSTRIQKKDHLFAMHFQALYSSFMTMWPFKLYVTLFWPILDPPSPLCHLVTKARTPPQWLLFIQNPQQLNCNSDWKTLLIFTMNQDRLLIIFDMFILYFDHFYKKIFVLLKTWSINPELKCMYKSNIINHFTEIWEKAFP